MINAKPDLTNDEKVINFLHAGWVSVPWCPHKFKDFIGFSFILSYGMASWKFNFRFFTWPFTDHLCTLFFLRNQLFLCKSCYLIRKYHGFSTWMDLLKLIFQRTMSFSVVNFSNKLQIDRITCLRCNVRKFS